MLRDAPGVYAQRKWGGDVRISIRGSGIGNANHNRGLLLAQDGVPLNEADGYGDSQIADPLNTRYAEVYRGGNALRFGGALLGGAINMVTPTGKDAGLRQPGPDRRRIVRPGPRAVAIAAPGRRLGRLRRRHQPDRPGLALAEPAEHPVRLAQHRPRRSARTARCASSSTARTSTRRSPASLTLAQFEADPHQSAAGQPRQRPGPQPARRARLAATTWRLNDSLVFQGAVYGVWKDLDHPIFQVIDQQSRNYGAFGRFDWDGQIGGKRADAFFGAWYRTGDMDSNFYVNNRGARGAPTSRTLQNAKAVDVFAEGRLFVTDAGGHRGRRDLEPGQRDYTSFAVPGVASTFNLKADKTYDWVSPRVGLLWQDEAGDQVFANLTRSVEPPNFSSMTPTNTGFAPVRAQKAWTGEIGTRGPQGPLHLRPDALSRRS
jgi:iron complex outermembrane receptor protein